MLFLGYGFLAGIECDHGGDSWDGIEWDGMGLNGIEWDGMDCRVGCVGCVPCTIQHIHQTSPIDSLVLIVSIVLFLRVVSIVFFCEFS